MQNDSDVKLDATKNEISIQIRKINDLIVDPTLKALLKPLSHTKKQWLRESLAALGVLEPLVIWEDLIIDGLDRYEICHSLGITEVPVVELPFKNKAATAYWRIQKHQNRKQMNTYCSIVAAINYYEGDLSEQAKQNQIVGGKRIPKDTQVWVNTEIAILAQTNPDYVSKVRNLHKNPEANAKLITELQNGERSIRSLANAKPTQKPKSTNHKIGSEVVQMSFDGETQIWNEWEKEYSPQVIEFAAQDIDLNTSDYFEKTKNIVRNLESDIIGLTAFIIRTNEQFYRLGFYRAQGNSNELAENPAEYFLARNKDLRDRFETWVKEVISKAQNRSQPPQQSPDKV